MKWLALFGSVLWTVVLNGDAERAGGPSPGTSYRAVGIGADQPPVRFPADAIHGFHQVG